MKGLEEEEREHNSKERGKERELSTNIEGLENGEKRS